MVRLKFDALQCACVCMGEHLSVNIGICFMLSQPEKNETQMVTVK